jgi:hypothetical protein
MRQRDASGRGLPIVAATVILLALVVALSLEAKETRAGTPADAVISVSSASADPNSATSVSISVTPNGAEVGALRVVVTYDNALLTPTSCNTSPFPVCNVALTANTVGFAWASVAPLSGVIGTLEFNTGATPSAAYLQVGVTTCADTEGFDLVCDTEDGTVTIVQSTPTPTPSPFSPTPPPQTPTPTVAQTATPTPGPQKYWGDVNCDTTVNAVDALSIQRWRVGLPYSKGPGCPVIGTLARVRPRAAPQGGGVSAIISIESGSGAEGSNQGVDLIFTPGGAGTVAAADVWVHYNPAVLTVIGCVPATCNPTFDADTVSIALANLSGLTGTQATITFNLIGAAGTSSLLDVDVQVCADDQGNLVTCTSQDGLLEVFAATPSPIPSTTPTPTPGPSLTAGPTPTPFPRPWGDVNCDTVVNAVDSLVLQRWKVGLSVTQMQPCPVIGAAYP